MAFFRFKIWNTFSFYKFVRFQGVFFLERVALATIFSRDSRQKYYALHAQLQFHAKYPLFANQTAGLP